MYRMLLVAALLISACAADQPPTAPQPDTVTALPAHEWVVDVAPVASVDANRTPHLRYPLQLGNEWKHRAHVTMTTIPDEGEPSELEMIRVTKSEITGASQYYGRCYTVEERTITEDVGDGEAVTQIVNYRQDRAGLYEVADASVAPTEGATFRQVDVFAKELTLQHHPEAWTNAFAAAQQKLQPLYAMRYGRGGVLEGELTRLQYPLHRGQEWVVIDDAFSMSASVERRVVLDLPTGRTPAWQVRMESSLYGPDDSVVFFYGRDGYLGWQVSVVGDVTDETGERIGTVLFHDEEYLESLSIDRQGEVPCDTIPRSGKAGTGHTAG